MTIGFGVLVDPSGRFSASASGSGLRGSGSFTTSAIWRESGDQANSDTLPLTSVILTASPPARFISHTCARLEPCRDERNARYFPSGLQRGADSPAGVEVTWICSRPSQLTIQISVSFLSVSRIERATV